MKTFNITPVNERIFILSGNAASGKSFFARAVKNSFIIDDIYMGMSCGTGIYVRTTLDILMNNKIPNIHGRTYSDSSLIFLITNDTETQAYIKDIVEEWLDDRKRRTPVNII